MRRFILSNKFGYDLREAVENPSFEISEIVVVDDSGIEIEKIPVTPLTLHMYNPEPDPNYRKPQKIITATGEIEIPLYIPDDMVANGENPFVQIIYRFVKRRDGITIEDIIRHVIKERRLLPANDYGMDRVKSLVYEMHNGEILGGLLIKKGNLYFAGAPLKTGRQLIRIYPGYDPFEYQIMEYLQNKGTSSRGEIHRYITDILKWARHPKLVEFYIDKLLRQGNIKRIGKDWFEYHKSLVPF